MSQLFPHDRETNLCQTGRPSLRLRNHGKRLRTGSQIGCAGCVKQRSEALRSEAACETARRHYECGGLEHAAQAGTVEKFAATINTGGACVPAVVVGMYAPFGVEGVYHATICMPWGFILALWHVGDRTMGAYIVTTGVATYAPPALLLSCKGLSASIACRLIPALYLTPFLPLSVLTAFDAILDPPASGALCRLRKKSP